MYKFAILLISCNLAANNPVQGAPTTDKSDNPLQGAPTTDEADNLLQDATTPDEADNPLQSATPDEVDNPLQGPPTADEVLESVYKEYQNHLKINDDIDLDEFMVFLGDDEKSRRALCEYMDKNGTPMPHRIYINVDRFKTYVKAVSETLAKDNDVATFAKECYEKVKHPKATINVTQYCK